MADLDTTKETMMKYTITLLNTAGIYTELTVDLPIDPETSYVDFVNDASFQRVISGYDLAQVIDILPHIEFHEPQDLTEELDYES